MHKYVYTNLEKIEINFNYPSHEHNKKSLKPTLGYRDEILEGHFYLILVNKITQRIRKQLNF